VDGLKFNHDSIDVQKQKQIHSEIESWKLVHENCNLIIKLHSANLGCSASVLSGVDWIASNEERFCVLEDDCIPSIDFFKYVRDGLQILNQRNEVLLISGSQFAPKAITKNSWLLSHYALTWGWATDSTRWKILRELLKYPQVKKCISITDYERRYWRAGSRRAAEGYVDVWDTILVASLFEHHFYSLLPGSNLVMNVGDDEDATHTTNDSTWLNQPLGKYVQSDGPLFNPKVEKWLRKHFYRIGFRHIFSTEVTRTLDIFGFHKKRVGSLQERWK